MNESEIRTARAGLSSRSSDHLRLHLMSLLVRMWRNSAFNSQGQPRKDNHAEVAGAQIHQAECAIRKVLLGKLFETNQEGKSQAADNGDPLPGWEQKRAEEAQVNEQDQNPIQGKMSCFVGIGNPIDLIENAKPSHICQDDDENDKKGKEDRQPLHPQDCFACNKK